MDETYRRLVEHPACNSELQDAIHETYESVMEKVQTGTVRNLYHYWLRSAQHAVIQFRETPLDALLQDRHNQPYDVFPLVRRALEETNNLHWMPMIESMVAPSRVESIRSSFPDVFRELWTDPYNGYTDGWIVTQESFQTGGQINRRQFVAQGLPRPIWIDKNGEQTKLVGLGEEFRELITSFWSTIESVYGENRLYIYAVVADVFRIPWYAACCGAVCGTTSPDWQWQRTMRKTYALQKEVRDWSRATRA